jgi:hypothetical protein
MTEFKTGTIVQKETLNYENYLPEWIYNKLPCLLKESTNLFNDRRSKDIYLTSALGVLSGCFPSVRGIYAGNEVSINIYTFVIGPPASGKANIKYAEELGQVFHNTLIKKNNNPSKVKQKKQSKQNEQMPINNEKLFIPGNISTAGLLFLLSQSKGYGVICETEADSMINSFKQDWGGYSDLLRKVFHNETISSFRKTENESLNALFPRLSLAIGGTQDQVQNLFRSTENGLFSRFLFYKFNSTSTWKDVSPDEVNTNYTKEFQKYSNDLNTIINEYSKFGELKIQLSNNQWEKLNKYGESIHDEYRIKLGDKILPSIKRLGINLYRLCMLLTILRNYDNKTLSCTMKCNNLDFNIAISLIGVYLYHTITVFESLPNVDIAKETILLEWLPKSFTKKEAIKIIKSKKLISDRTIASFLSKNIAMNKLTKEKHGNYTKND